MKSTAFLCFLLVFTATSYSQTYKEVYALKLSSELRFNEAYPVWSELAQKTVKSKNQNWNNLRMAIEAAYNSEQYDKALYWSQYLASCNKLEVKDWIVYFLVLQITNNHSRLTGAIDAAILKFPSSVEIQSWKRNVPIILKQLTESSEYKIAKFRQKEFGEEFCAVPYNGGFVLVSNRRNTGFANRIYPRTGQHFTDLIAINGSKDILQDELWKEIKRTNPHDGPISFSPDSSLAVLTVNNREIDKIGKVNYARLLLKIYRLNNGKWKEEEAFPYNNKSYSVGHGTFDLNGNILFVSDKPGGFGGADIYKSKWIDGKWSEPVNLGDKINTSGDELFPHVSNGGRLYFSSNGWPGNGGLDVFYQEDYNLNPKHLGNPVNSNADDFGFFIDEYTGKGFLSSNRNAFKDEIYTISKPIYKIDAEVILKSCDNKPLASKSILVKNLKTLDEEVLITDKNGKISIHPLLHSAYRFEFSGEGNNEGIFSEYDFDSEGVIKIQLTSVYKSQKIKINVVDENNMLLEGVLLTYYSQGKSVTKFLTKKENLPLLLSKNELSIIDSIVASKINYRDVRFVFKADNECNADQNSFIILEKIADSDYIKLENIYYDFDLWNIRPEGKKELDKLVKYMNSHPDLIIELSSHTDCRGTDQYNDWLSDKRSNSCVNYIKSKGILPEKIIAKGFGEKQLVNNCIDESLCSEEEHQKNRRTELKIKLDE
ncbi:MAG: OmpA family protein [Crocinitomicaceae bacterium]